MNRFVALYRGINVGGNNMVKMDALRALHEGLGHADVASYIQSGNVIFSAKGSAEQLARKTAGRFAEEFGFSARVMVVSVERLAAIIAKSPYSKLSVKDPKTVHACICEGVPNGSGLAALLKKTGGSEKYAIGEGVIYLHTPEGMGTSKFAAGMEKACGVPITARNWRTIETLREMLEGGGAASP